MRISDWSSDVCSSDLAGAELRFLPAYSPDFNPIEMAFAKLKAFLKKHAPRTVDALWDTIARGIDTEPPWVCRRLRTLRGWSDGQAGDRGTAFTGSARASGADGAGACGRVRLALGSETGGGSRRGRGGQ